MEPNTLSSENNNNNMLVPSLQTAIKYNKAINELPACMASMGRQPLMEYGWNKMYGCYQEDHEGWIEISQEEEETYEMQKKGFEHLREMAETDIKWQNHRQQLIQKIGKGLMKLVAGEETFGLLLSYGDSLQETSFMDVDSMFLQAVKLHFPKVCYKIIPVLICETADWMASERPEKSDQPYDFSSLVYSATPEDISYCLNRKDTCLGHPDPLGGGCTNFYNIEFLNYYWRRRYAGNIHGPGIPNTIYFQRALVVTSWSATAHKKRKNGDVTVNDVSNCPVCQCDEPKECYIRKSNTEKNPNKLFYTCRNGECKFFQWI